MDNKTILSSLVLSLLLGLVVCFFLSIFANSSSSFSHYDDRYWFMINRGYPQAWAGTSVPGRPVPWPLVKAPLVKASISHPDMGYYKTWDKVIDLSRFMPLWLASSLATLPLTWIIVKTGQENYRLRVIWQGGCVASVVAVILLYFFWFPAV